MSARCSHCGAAKAGSFSSCPRCGREEPPEPSDPSVVPLLAELRPEAEPPLPAEHEARRPRTPLPVAARPVERKAPPRSVIAAVAESPLAAAPGPIVDPSDWFEDSRPGEEIGGRRHGEASALPPAPRMRGETPAPFYLPPPSTLRDVKGGQGAALHDAFVKDVTPPARRNKANREPLDARTPHRAEPELAPELVSDLVADESRPTPSSTDLPVMHAASRAEPIALDVSAPPRPRRGIIALVVLILVGAAVGLYLSSPSITTDGARADDVKR